MKKKLHYFVISLLISILFLPFSIVSAELSQARKFSASGLRLLPNGAQDPEERDLAQLTNDVSALSLRDFQERVTEEVFQQAYLKASNSQADDQFGYSMAVSGNTLVVGAPREDSDADVVNGDQKNNQAGNAGAAYVFVRSGDEWAFQAYLKASNSNKVDNFGYSVAISGDTIVVGAPYEDSAATIVNGNQDDNSLESAGAAYVFVREGETWTPQAYLKPLNTGWHDCFGQAVDISGDTIVVGAYEEDGASEDSEYDEGAAYVFVRDDISWSQQDYLKASNPGEADLFGYSVAISGDSIVVGAPYEVDEGVHYGGAAYVFVRDGTAWSEQDQIIASNGDSADFFGISVDISGTTVVVGAQGEESNASGVNGDEDNDAANFAGAAYVFAQDEGTWSQQAYLKASNAGEGDYFGNSVAVSGNTIVVGAYYEGSSATGIDGNQADNAALNSGASYVFSRENNVWSQKAYLKASNTGAGDQFGQSVDLSFYTLVVGADFEDSNATGIDGDGANDDAEDSGAGYVFEMEPECVLHLPLIVR